MLLEVLLNKYETQNTQGTETENRNNNIRKNGKNVKIQMQDC